MTTFEIDKMRVGKPCPVRWDSMDGDDRVRECGSCELKIFNIEAMTREQVHSLIETHEGRLCIRLVLRSDGTVATNDCPVGVRAFRKKAARHAAAFFGTVLGMFSVSFGQKNETVIVQKATLKNVATDRNWLGHGSIKGVVVDANGGVLPDASIELFEESSKKSQMKTRSGDDGTFSFPDLVPGKYRIEVKREGFKRYIVTSVIVEENTETELDVKLDLAGRSEVVGIFLEAPMVDMTVSGPTPKTITRSDLDRIPGGRPY